MKTGIFFCLFACSSACFGQLKRTFGINTYKLPSEKGITRYDRTYNEDGAYSVFYSAIVGDSIFIVREQFEVKNTQAVMTAVYIEHFGLKNETFDYVITPTKSDSEEGHAETWSVSVKAKTPEGKTAYQNGHKWMIYPPEMPAYKESLGAGYVQIFFSRRAAALAFEEELNGLLGKEANGH
jgi:hypothetical protein